MFVVAAKVFPLFNGLVRTYAAILCVYPNSRTENENIGRQPHPATAVDLDGMDMSDLGGNIADVLS